MSALVASGPLDSVPGVVAAAVAHSCDLLGDADFRVMSEYK